LALLDDATIAELRATEILGLGHTAVGGTSWVPQTVTGDGVTSDRVVSDGTPITGYVEQRRSTGASRTAAGAVVPEAYWVFVSTAGTAPTQGSVIKSASDATLRFRVLGLDMWDVWPTYILEPITT
jgi:hypothetical protein